VNLFFFERSNVIGPCVNLLPGPSNSGADLSVMELPVHIDLALSDVASQIRDGMGDVVVGHRQNGNLDRTYLV
jgi:hypothetical protein